MFSLPSIFSISSFVFTGVSVRIAVTHFLERLGGFFGGPALVKGRTSSGLNFGNLRLTV